MWNFKNFLQLTFYVKSVLVTLKYLKPQIWHYSRLRIKRFAIFNAKKYTDSPKSKFNVSKTARMVIFVTLLNQIWLFIEVAGRFLNFHAVKYLHTIYHNKYIFIFCRYCIFAQISRKVYLVSSFNWWELISTVIFFLHIQSIFQMYIHNLSGLLPLVNMLLCKTFP